ncbi:MAG TPA: hypothetical protein VGU44_04730 [Gammaproteobacteria bacterium]|nr:hypothetical protein [Gammaproteobacteria bacterium]
MISSIDLMAYNGFFENRPLLRGTLYELPTNIDNHRIFLYSQRSESVKAAASRFLLMHQYPFAAGGYAGRFLRASFGLEFVSNRVEAEFRYSLDQQGCLKAMRYETLQNAWILLFEGEWHDFVNQYSKAPEHLHAFPGFKAKKPQIMTFIEAKNKIENLTRLCPNKPIPGRFKAYLRFVAALKKDIAKKFDFD